jgi:hypothetical protein
MSKEVLQAKYNIALDVIHELITNNPELGDDIGMEIILTLFPSNTHHEWLLDMFEERYTDYLRLNYEQEIKKIRD